jgi:hypothetical protein
MGLRYMGFDQHDNIRAYKFDGIEKGQPIVRLVVTADMALFLKHHINIQEGPDLCAHKLSADSAAIGPKDHQLTDEDLLVFATACADEKAHKAESRRKANLHRRWPSRPPYQPPH